MELGVDVSHVPVTGLVKRPVIKGLVRRRRSCMEPRWFLSAIQSAQDIQVIAPVSLFRICCVLILGQVVVVSRALNGMAGRPAELCCKGCYGTEPECDLPPD